LDRVRVENACMKAESLEENMMGVMILLQHIRCFLECFRIKS
jgi:hypothetical protein